MDPNSACQPEIAPQAMVTNSIGQIGWIAGTACRMFPAASLACVIGIQLANTLLWKVTAFIISGLPNRPRTAPMIAPRAEKMMVRNVTQNPM